MLLQHERGLGGLEQQAIGQFLGERKSRRAIEEARRRGDIAFERKMEAQTQAEEARKALQEARLEQAGRPKPITPEQQIRLGQADAKIKAAAAKTGFAQSQDLAKMEVGLGEFFEDGGAVKDDPSSLPTMNFINNNSANPYYWTQSMERTEHPAFPGPSINPVGKKIPLPRLNIKGKPTQVTMNMIVEAAKAAGKTIEEVLTSPPFNVDLGGQ